MPIPPMSESLLVYVSRETKDALRALSKTTGAPISFHIRAFIADGLQAIAQGR
jgi:predicted DNA-binding protein